MRAAKINVKLVAGCASSSHFELGGIAGRFV
jgi:hypothetical protein